jgi:zinc and cadmium transporter
LIPTLHKKTDIKTSLQQIALIFAGVGLIVLLHGVAHDMHLDSPDIAEQVDAEPSSIL